MGIDVQAYIVVGLSLEELYIDNAYDFVKLYNDGDILQGAYNETMSVVKPFEDSDEGGTIVGFVIAASESYWPVEIGLGTLSEKFIAAGTSFYGAFKKSPKLYLVPRQW